MLQPYMIRSLFGIEGFHIAWYGVIFEWENYAADPIRVFAIWEGGLAIYGGVWGLLTAIIFCRHKKIPLLHFWDLIVPSLVLGQVIGRWGNGIRLHFL